MRAGTVRDCESIDVSSFLEPGDELGLSYVRKLVNLLISQSGLCTFKRANMRNLCRRLAPERKQL